MKSTYIKYNNYYFKSSTHEVYVPCDQHTTFWYETPSSYIPKYGKHYPPSNKTSNKKNIVIDGGIVYALTDDVLLMIDSKSQFHRICKPATIEVKLNKDLGEKCFMYEWFNHGVNISKQVFTWAKENDIDLLYPTPEESQMMKLLFYT